MALFVVVLAAVVAASIAYWARRYRAYGLALEPSRRPLGAEDVETRLASIEEWGTDRVALMIESKGGGQQLEMIIVELDDRAMALETLEAWREAQAPLVIAPWGASLIRLRPIDQPSGLTLRRATT